MLLIMKLTDDDPDVRSAAAYALQGTAIADGLAAIALVQTLEDTDPEVREAAAYALRGTTIKDRSAALLLAKCSR